MTVVDDTDLVRGKNVVAVIDFHETSIYPTDSSPGERPERIVATDPRGRYHQVQHRAGNPDGTYEDDSPEYWSDVTEALAPAGAILLLGHGVGRANASQHWVSYVDKHRTDVAAKVVADVRVDISHLDADQVLRYAQQYFGASALRDAGDSRRGGPSDSTRSSERASAWDEQLQKIKTGKGFIAALDQSGGSTANALRHYGLDDTTYANDQEMFDLIHRMRTRIITSPAFTGERILGAILFEMTMDRRIDGGEGSAEYLWDNRAVVPFLKVDKGLAAESDGVQLMRPIPDLDALLERAKTHGVFGTKMRSFIKLANASGIDAVVHQQFELARRITDAGLVAIIEPEVDIRSPQKAHAEVLLQEAILAQLGPLHGEPRLMLKLSLPVEDDFYADLVGHPQVLRVLALSGGYSRQEADERLARNHGVIASFSRALTEGLAFQQTDAEFDAALDASIRSIYEASAT